MSPLVEPSGLLQAGGTWGGLDRVVGVGGAAGLGHSCKAAVAGGISGCVSVRREPKEK